MQRAPSLGDLMSRTSQVYRFAYAAGLGDTKKIPFAPKKREYMSLIAAEEDMEEEEEEEE
jgi:hypothetical protein